MGYEVYLTEDQIYDSVLQLLDELIKNEGNETIVNGLHIVRAYLSVPGTYLNGLYDYESSMLSPEILEYETLDNFQEISEEIVKNLSMWVNEDGKVAIELQWGDYVYEDVGSDPELIVREILTEGVGFSEDEVDLIMSQLNREEYE